MTRTDPLVTVLLPTLNRARQLPACLDAVLAQTETRFELLVCDDASTDETPEMLARSQDRDPRVVVVRNEVRKGLPGNRNAGLAHARGRYVYFIEDDMILEPDCVAKLLACMEELEGKGVRVGGVAPAIDAHDHHEAHGESLLDFSCRDTSTRLGVPCTVSRITGVHRYNFSPRFPAATEVPDVHACSFYRASALREVGGYDDVTFGRNYLYEETDMNHRLAKRGYRFFFEPRAIAHHHLGLSGGCRVSPLSYARAFFVNHAKFVWKNHRSRSVWMIPAFTLFMGWTGTRALFARMGRRA